MAVNNVSLLDYVKTTYPPDNHPNFMIFFEAYNTTSQIKTTKKFAEAYVAIKILSGASTGKELPLVKVVTTIGKPGEAVIAITKRPKSYMVAHVEGSKRPSINGVSFGIEAVPIKDGDLLELAGTAMQFIQN